MRGVLTRAAFIAILAAHGTSPRAAAQLVSGAPLIRGEVTFVFHSTIVGRLEGRVPIAHAEFAGDRLESIHGLALVNVADMQTGNGARDRHLRETMEADAYPLIRFDLVGVESGAAADTTPVTLEGTLTLHGVARPVRAGGTVVAGPQATEVTASFSLDMRDYGIRPPVRALVLHVAPEVVIVAHLSFGATRGR
jgi:polyisoprenoid-binding protein YceI